MPTFTRLHWDDGLFLVVVGSVAALLAVALGLMLLALFLRWRNERVARLWEALEARWEPLLLDVLVGERPGEDLQAAVHAGESLRFLDFLLRFVRRVAGTEVGLLRSLARPHLDRLARAWDEGSAERRARAVQTLGLLGMDGHEAVVVDALDDPSPLVSIVAARALTTRGHPAHFEQVLERLVRYQDWHPAFLAGMLAEAGAGAAPLLRAALADRTADASSRAVVARALEHLRDPEAADVAADVLLDTTDPDLAVACLQILAEVGGARHRGVLLSLLDARSFAVRSHSLKALRALGDPANQVAFQRALDDPSPWVALEGARGLRALGAGEVLEKLAVGVDDRAALARQVVAE